MATDRTTAAQITKIKVRRKPNAFTGPSEDEEPPACPITGTNRRFRLRRLAVTGGHARQTSASVATRGTGGNVLSVASTSRSSSNWGTDTQWPRSYVGHEPAIPAGRGRSARLPRAATRMPFYVGALPSGPLITRRS